MKVRWLLTAREVTLTKEKRNQRHSGESMSLGSFMHFLYISGPVSAALTDLFHTLLDTFTLSNNSNKIHLALISRTSFW